MTVWFDHGKCSLRCWLKFLFGENVSIVYKLELAGMNCDHGAKEKFFACNSWTTHSLHEHSSVFEIILQLKIGLRIIQPMQNEYDLPFHKYYQ